MGNQNKGLLLTHWGRATHICIGNLTIIGSDNGLSPDRRQSIIWTNAGILLIGPLGINFNEILIGIQTSSFKNMRLKMASAKWRPFCLGLNVLTWFTSAICNTFTYAQKNANRSASKSSNHEYNCRSCMSNSCPQGQIPWMISLGFIVCTSPRFKLFSSDFKLGYSERFTNPLVFWSSSGIDQGQIDFAVPGWFLYFP